ncbi:MAG: sulfite exporter TauE/SafE family protein, partial [SAR202 cluster bacterium]|nr:sulfite exporter TauE/SafE family protein [SAR202 cluster bacterium]
MSVTEFLELVAIGIGAGTWGTLIGAGGGFIIVPLLLFRDSTLEAATVTAVSLIAVLA